MKITKLIIALAATTIPAAVFGHHSHAEFSNETVEVTGVLTDVFWQNPHIALHLEVEGENGESETWRIEGWSRPAALESAGVTSELFSVGDTLVVAGRPSRRRQAFMDVRRMVHLNGDVAGHAASRLGYSVGRWEDASTLVVETTGINYPYFHIDGTAQSDAVKITERYSLSDDQTRLDYQLTIEDSVTLKQPAIIETHFLALDEPFDVYDCNVF